MRNEPTPVNPHKINVLASRVHTWNNARDVAVHLQFSRWDSCVEVQLW